MQTKHIIKPILFLTGLFILLFVLSYLFIPNNGMEDGPYKKMRGILNAPKNSIDYITVGDSECNTSISPMEIWEKYGYAGYNCGVPGQRIQDTYYLLEKLLQTQSPKVVLLETNTFYRDFKYTNVLQDATDEAAKKIFPIYKYHNTWKYFNLDMLKNIKQKMKRDRSNVLKGYQYNVVVKPYTKGPYIHKTKETVTIDEQPLFYMNKIVDLCKENNIQLILYSVPSPLCWTYSKHNSAAAFAEQNNLLYIDLNLHNKEIGIDWSKDTKDKGNHLNFYGSKKVTSYMGTYLSEHTKLIDRRKEKQYRSWNTALKKYRKITNQT